MENLLFTAPMHRDIGSSAMFGMYPTMLPGMGMYGAGLCGGSYGYVQGPGLTKDKFQMVNSKRQEGKFTAKKAVFGAAAAILSIFLLHKLPIKKGATLLNKAINKTWNGVKAVGKFVIDWVKWGANKIGALLNRIPKAPTP